MLARGDPDALAEWDSALRGFCSSLRDDRARLLSHLILRLSETWSGEPYEKAKEGIIPTLDVVMEAVLQLESLSVRLHHHERALRSYLELGGAAAGAASLSSATAAGTPSAATSGPPLAWKTRSGQPLELLDLQCVDASRIDWTSDDFARDFWERTHHGYTGADYMALVAVFPRVMKAVEQDPENEGGFPPGSLERASYQSFVGDSAVRISDGPDGKLSIDNGRHRLFAARQQGIRIPVVWVSRKPAASFETPVEKDEKHAPSPASVPADPDAAEEESPVEPPDRAWSHAIPAALGMAFLTLVHAILEEIVGLLQLGFDPAEVRADAAEAFEIAFGAIERDTRPVTGPEEEIEIATVGAGGDGEIGRLVALAMRHAGPDAGFRVSPSPDGRTELRVFEVRTFECGLRSPATGPERDPCPVEIHEPRVLVSEGFPPAVVLAAALEASSTASTSTTVGMSTAVATSTATAAAAAATGRLVVITGPGSGAHAFPESRTAFAHLEVQPTDGRTARDVREEIAGYTGGRVLITAAASAGDPSPPGFLGAAHRITAAAGAHATFVIPEASGPARPFTPEPRLATSSGTVVGRETNLVIGGRSHAEATERGARAEASWHSLRSALKGGVVASIAFAWARASVSVGSSLSPGRPRPGADAVCRALEAPLRRVAAASGHDARRVVEAIRNSASRPWQGSSSGTAPAVAAAIAVATSHAASHGGAHASSWAVARAEPARAVASALCRAAAVAGIPLSSSSESRGRELPWPLEEIWRDPTRRRRPIPPHPRPEPPIQSERSGFRSLVPGDPTWPALVSREQHRDAEALGIPVAIECLASGIVLVLLPAGTFQMGATPGDEEAGPEEEPRHTVNLPACYAGVAPVTQEQWQRVTGARPSRFRGTDRPVEQVSWDDTSDFLALVNSSRVGPGLRLPSEAEWEYAARAGTTTRYWWGDDFRSGLANARGGPGETTPVDTYPPNGWGLRDVLGNVWEWCADGWHASYRGAPSDGLVWRGGNDATPVLRGGSWNALPIQLRASQRERAPRPFGVKVRGLRCFRDVDLP